MRAFYELLLWSRRGTQASGICHIDFGEKFLVKYIDDEIVREIQACFVGKFFVKTKAMLLIRTRIGESKIHGIGLFAEEDIPIGTTIWRYVPNLDLALSIKEVEELPVVAQDYIYKHAWLSKKLNKYILSFDDDRFANHSEESNVGEKPTNEEDEPSVVALTDIRKGEEITFNYQDIDSDYKRKLLPEEGDSTELKKINMSAVLQ